MNIQNNCLFLIKYSYISIMINFSDMYNIRESALDKGMREGIVFRDRKGERSFKAVSNEFLAKYHG